MHALKIFIVIPILMTIAITQASAALITVDATGINIPAEVYPFPLDIEIPDAAISPFFNLVYTGVQNNELDIFTPGFIINLDGSATLLSGATGSLGTFTYTFDFPIGDLRFADISILPPEPFPVAALILGINGTLTSVNGPGFSIDPLVGTSGLHTKLVLSGPALIPPGSPLSSLTDNAYAIRALHVFGLHASRNRVPEPSSLLLIVSGLLGLIGLKQIRGE